VKKGHAIVIDLTAAHTQPKIKFENLEKTLTDTLDFKLEIKSTYNENTQVQNYLVEYVAKVLEPTIHHTDCFLCVLFLNRFNDEVQLSKLFDTLHNCQALKSKPKLFLICAPPQDPFDDFIVKGPKLLKELNHTYDDFLIDYFITDDRQELVDVFCQELNHSSTSLLLIDLIYHVNSRLLKNGRHQVLLQNRLVNSNVELNSNKKKEKIHYEAHSKDKKKLIELSKARVLMKKKSLEKTAQNSPPTDADPPVPFFDKSTE
jgi:hypothetical protein